MSTVRDLLSGSLRLIGALATGETPSASEQADALSVLNDMLDSWSNESLIIYSDVKETFSLVSGQQSYTMGPSGNFDTVRPQKVNNALISISSPAFELPIEILNQDQWAMIASKSTTGSMPLKLFIDFANPLLTLYFWPVPSATASVVLYSSKPLTSFASANTVVTLPPGYKKALRYCLALELAPEYGKQVDQAVAAGALEGKANIKRMNSKTVLLGVDGALQSTAKTFNFNTGEGS